MRTLSSSELLQAWEHAAGLPTAQRALVLLEAACDGADDDPRHYSLGRRDRHLLQLRESLFGRRVAALVDCPTCSHRMEVSFNVGDVLLPVSLSVEAMPLVLTEQGYEIRVRLPDSTDLMALQMNSDGAEANGKLKATQLLLSRCLLGATLGGKAVSAEALPEAIRDSISKRMTEADPQAQVLLKLECDRCDHAWHDDFRIDVFLWGEVQAWAGRLVHEIHQLACAYGWSESEILELGPLRRNLYLTLIAE